MRKSRKKREREREWEKSSRGNGLESEISMKKWKNNGFDMKFISSC